MDQEYELVVKFKEQREKVSKLKESLSEAQKELQATEDKLLEMMEAQGKTSTAKYDGLGFCGIVKPRVFASYDKEFEEEFFKYLESADRADLIKPTVNANSLSTFVKEKLENGESLPEFIKYHLKRSVRFYAKEN